MHSSNQVLIHFAAFFVKPFKTKKMDDDIRGMEYNEDLQYLQDKRRGDKVGFGIRSDL